MGGSEVFGAAFLLGKEKLTQTRSKQGLSRRRKGTICPYESKSTAGITHCYRKAKREPSLRSLRYALVKQDEASLSAAKRDPSLRSG
jgi:hypothetical protein